MLVNFEYLDNKNCLLYHNAGYMHCSWLLGKRVVTVEFIRGNYPPLTLCTWKSVAEWWKAVSDVCWLEDDLRPVARDLLADKDLGQPARRLIESWLRDYEEDERDEDDERENENGDLGE